MASKKRSYMKRQIGEAYRALSSAVDHIAAVGAEFNGVHPEIENVLVLCAQGIDQVQTLLKAFAFEAWGRDQVDFDSWANTGQQWREDNARSEPVDEESA